MAHEVKKVPFGYEPPRGQGERGSLWVYDTFEGYSAQELLPVLQLMEARRFARLILYPLHEETVRRMVKHAVSPYYARVDALRELLEREAPATDYSIEGLDGKRKKYTPIDMAFRWMEEKYEKPHFVYMSDWMANLFAGYEAYDVWIKKLRLFITPETSAPPHPNLLKHESRWELVPPGRPVR